MRKIVFLLFGVFLISLVGSGVFQSEAYTIDGNKVYIDDNKAYISAEPHTLIGAGWVEFNFTSKIYTGDVDMILGFDTTSLVPKRVQKYDPSFEFVEHSYQCAYDFNYTLSPNYAWCYKDIEVFDGENSSHYEEEIVFERAFDTGNLELKTIYWDQLQLVEWKDVVKTFNSINYDYQGMNKWWDVKNFDIVQDEQNVFRVEVHPKTMSESRKYWFAIKPSSQSISESIAAGTFYALDPWIEGLNTQLHVGYKFDETSGSIAYDVLNKYNATYVGGDADDWITGKIGNAVGLDGVDEWINGGTFGDLGTSDTATYSFWFNTTATTYSKPIGYSAGGGGRYFQTFWNDAYTTFASNTQENTGGDNLNSVSEVFDAVNDGAWHHIVLRIQYSTNDVKIYVDGDNKSITYSLAESPDTLSAYAWSLGIGAEIPAGEIAHEFLIGGLDEFYIWNRTLSDSEILALWNDGAGITYPPENCWYEHPDYIYVPYGCEYYIDFSEEVYI